MLFSNKRDKSCHNNALNVSTAHRTVLHKAMSLTWKRKTAASQIAAVRQDPPGLWGREDVPDPLGLPVQWDALDLWDPEETLERPEQQVLMVPLELQKR